ncbi:MAG: hypothetical protein FJZ43_04805 [Candidatus Staskawiczbacteria bacterium]|nr:hypothetical protein [Candidatus Staskawiczbacteria bacterium]
MSEKNWEECLSGGYATTISRDIKKSESLKRTAEGRIRFFEVQSVNEENVNYIFEGYYTSIIEFLHSFTISNGYNISNHVCIGCYLRDVMRRNDLYRLFEDLRYKRNSLIYYGSRMDFETAKQAIEKCRKLIKELKEIINKHFK